ncbi:sugar phosphate isomerase/epimerase family protein [Nonomuraea insulae]|uniref:Sugar phosphate isomerase/epimerase family protein n=1 Tax=Nonomuraea insulae TaxID=1616787 RepID=A0ABW1CPF8_9ACTN
MRVIVLTKPFGAVEPARLAGSLAEAGADGADLVIRAGQTVSPDKPGGITAVAKELERAGLSLDVVTTDLLGEDDGETAGRVLAACGDAGVPMMRVGFYRYDPALGYGQRLERARRGLATLARSAEHHGVRLALQLHHGTIHPSGALALRLVEGLDEVRFYADPGNQAKEGSEDWRLHLDLIGERVACVGVKNATWTQGADGWTCDWQPFADGGIIRWAEILRSLRERGYTGPLSLHVHYPAADPLTALRRDLRYLRGML